MTDNEIKAIEELKSHIKNCEYSINAMECTPEDYDEDMYKSIKEELKTSKDLLDLIEKQEKEIEKKDKIIDLMAEDYSKYQTLRSYPNEITETAFGIKNRIMKQFN